MTTGAWLAAEMFRTTTAKNVFRQMRVPKLSRERGAAPPDHRDGLISNTFYVPSQTPLTTLLSWVWVAHTIEVDNMFEAMSSELVGRHFRISLPMWTNALRFISEDGITIDELQMRARAASNIGGLERWRWISVGDGGETLRDGYGSQRGIKGGTIVRPTRAGVYARRLWPRVVADVEALWRARFGVEVIDALHGALLALGEAMPWSPPEVHPSDGFRTHIVDGADTRDPVLPLVALLGQVLTSLTLHQEAGSEVSLPLSADFLRVIGSGVVRTSDLPALAGVSKEAATMAAGFLVRNRLAVPGVNRTVSLSPDGLDALDGYRHRGVGVRHTALRGALEAIVVQKEALATALVPPEGCWRGERPYLAQTKRLLADPTGALPWQPMVLHRGGWPDGS
jgi:hypothetical protein